MQDISVGSGVVFGFVERYPELWYSLRFGKGLMAETDAKSIFDMEPDAATEARLDADAEAAFKAGRVVPHGRVREWLTKLAKGEKVPPPRA